MLYTLYAPAYHDDAPDVVIYEVHGDPSAPPWFHLGFYCDTIRSPLGVAFVLEDEDGVDYPCDAASVAELARGQAAHGDEITALTPSDTELREQIRALRAAGHAIPVTTTRGWWGKGENGRGMTLDLDIDHTAIPQPPRWPDQDQRGFRRRRKRK